MQFEYKVVPAPTRGKKIRGLKSPADRFANTLSELMNEMAAEGWEYQRADTLPSEERAGLTGKSTVFQNVLVFRRAAAEAARSTDAAEVAPEDGAKAPLASPRVEFERVERTPAPRLPGASHEAPKHKVPGPTASRDNRDVAAE
jgi:hypothetical protein